MGNTVATCNGDGTCSYANKADATACDDGDPCTKADRCFSGRGNGTVKVVSSVPRS